MHPWKRHTPARTAITLTAWASAQPNQGLAQGNAPSWIKAKAAATPLAISAASISNLAVPLAMDYQKAAQHESSDSVPYDGGMRTSPSSSPKEMSGRYRDIFVALAVITLPMLVLPAIIFTLVFHYRLTQSDPPFESLHVQTSSQTDPNVYYVNFSATQLVFVASWTSTLALSLVSSVMILYSYPIAVGILRRSERNEYRDLPTPYQLGILVELMNGGFGSLVRWIRYVFGWRNRRSKVAPEVRWSVVTLASVISLSLLLSFADTWLHVTTKTVPYIRVSADTQPQNSFGRGLSNTCLSRYQENTTSKFGIAPCTITIAATNIFLEGSAEAYETLNNMSSNNSLKTVSIGPTYTLLADPNPPLDVDFTASTIGVSTQCTPISKECDLRAPIGASTPFKCPNINLAGNVQVDPWMLNFFNASDGNFNATAESAINPFYWALASRIDGVYSIANDPEVVTPMHGGLASVLWCNTTVYDVVYSQVNGNISKLVATPSNGTVGGIISAPINPYGGGFGMNQLQNGIHVAALSSSAQGMADTFATIFSQTALGFAAGAMSPRLNTEEQTRDTLLVARVSKVALYALIMLCLIYALLGISLAVVALSTSATGVTDVRARLSVVGLVAQGFEKRSLGKPVEIVEESFEEWEGQGSGRVGISKSDLGGWMFETSTPRE